MSEAGVPDWARPFFSFGGGHMRGSRRAAYMVAKREKRKRREAEPGDAAAHVRLRPDGAVRLFAP